MPVSGTKYEFTQKNLDNAPDTAGVYALFNGDELIYIGRAQGGTVTIRSRLKDHLSGHEGKGTQGATKYAREETTRPVAREKELLDEYQTQHGRLPRYNERVG